MKNIYTLSLGSHEYTYSFLLENTYKFFVKSRISPSHLDPDIVYTKELLNYYRSKTPDGVKNEYIEYRSLAILTSKMMLKHSALLFHCVSFEYHGLAWLLSAPSGTGKTTQYLNWIKQYSDEITMICGDMPVFENQNGLIRICPSPWNGKERIGNDISAPLGGIIFLEQSITNEIKPIEISDAIIQFFRQLVYKPDSCDEITSISNIIAPVFDQYPIWVFRNNGSEESTKLLRQTILNYLEETS